MAHHTELDDELVDQFLSESLVNESVFQIVLDVDVEEGRGIAQRHGGTVLLLYCGEIGHVDPLHGLLCRIGRTTQFQTVVFAHHLDFLQRLDLFGHLLTQTDAGIVHRTFQIAQVLLLGLDEAVAAVKGQTAIIADDAAAGIVVGQTGQEAQRTEAADLFGIDVKDTVIVCLAITGEDVLHLRAYLHAVFGTGLLHHLDAAEGLDGTLQEHIGLQAYDQLVLAVYVSGLMGSDGRHRVRVERTHAVVGAFLLDGSKTLVPNAECTLRGTYKERSIALVRSQVTPYEVRHVDSVIPQTGNKMSFQIHKQTFL